MITKKDSNKARVKRHQRLRNKISGTSESPRLCVYRSNAHIYAQIIDDAKGVTICSASTLEKGFDDSGTKKESAKKVGVAIAKKAIDAGVKTVVFDRGGYKYHGRVQEVAAGAREAGLEF